MFMRSDQFSLQRDMIGEQRIGCNTFTPPKVFFRMTRFEGRCPHFKMLPINTPIELFQPESIIGKDA